jgi:hypothetical protein
MQRKTLNPSNPYLVKSTITKPLFIHTRLFNLISTHVVNMRYTGVMVLSEIFNLISPRCLVMITNVYILNEEV